MFAASLGVTLIVLLAKSLRSSGARRRTAQLAQVAAKLNLQFTPSDPMGCERLPFSAFERLREPRGENLMSGTAGPCPVRIFDLRWVVDRESGHASERSRTFMAVDLGGVFPHLRLSPQGLLGTLVEHTHANDIQLEWEEFNDAFVITCDDERFARALLDPQMMEFLHKVGRGTTIELRGRWLLLDPERLLAPEEWRLLHIFAVEFPARVPGAVWSFYPGPGANPDRRPQPEAPRPELLAPRHEYTGQFNWLTGRDDRPELPPLGTAREAR